jgi:hypothetical protein
MEESDIVLGYLAHFVRTALIDLVRCLKEQGALGERQYESAIRATLEKEGAPTGRLDYVFLAELLRALEKHANLSPRVIPFDAPSKIDDRT